MIECDFNLFWFFSSCDFALSFAGVIKLVAFFSSKKVPDERYMDERK